MNCSLSISNNIFFPLLAIVQMVHVQQQVHLSTLQRDLFLNTV